MPTVRFAIPVATAALAATTCADLPTYPLELQARTNFATNPGGAFNIPGNYFFNSEDIRINNLRKVAFHLSATPGAFQSVWYGNAASGGIVYNSANDAFLSRTSVNNNERVIWEETFVTTDGLYFYDDTTAMSGFLTSRPFGTSDWGTPNINDSGQVGFRATFGFSGRAFVSWDPATPTTVAEHVVETALDPGSPFAFLFTPDFNNNRQIAGKGRIGSTSGSAPDEIRIWNSDGTSTLIAFDNDGANPMTIFTGFDNSVALNDNGWVAFVASTISGDRGVYASNGISTLTIATEADPDISDIEFFSPDINNDNLVTFRAFDGTGKRAIWVGDGTDLVRVATALDIVPTDLGDGRIDQNTASSPVFGGAPKINDHGDVAFNCGLTPPDNNQIEWGSGVYIAMAVTPVMPCPGDADGDRDVDFDDLNIVLEQWNTAGPEGDIFPIPDGDGAVNFDDLNEVLVFWNVTCP